jgi:acetoin utilization deacetylase AcuC-like enzyme
MATRIPLVWSEACLRHDPSREVWIGMPGPGSEVAKRATVIRTALLDAGAELVPADAHDDEILLAIHDRDFVDHLAGVYAEWVARGYPGHGQDRVVPYVFPTAGMLDCLPSQVPYATHGRAGLYGYDTMTLVGPGTWEAARGAVDAALTAVALVASGQARVAYALCRPPGHHVTRRAYGGSCYLNNAAAAAEGLRRAGFDRVAIVDIDAHHGNGTQAIFYDRSDVFYGSVHVDPGAGWFPHYVGFAGETGHRDGKRTTQNVPLAPGTGDRAWLDGVTSLISAISDFGAAALVVSLGVDAAVDDPESPLRVTAGGYETAGRLAASLDVPIVAVQEGGYHLPTLGSLVLSTVTGLTAA